VPGKLTTDQTMGSAQHNIRIMNFTPEGLHIEKEAEMLSYPPGLTSGCFQRLTYISRVPVTEIIKNPLEIAVYQLDNHKVDL
jgi:hypothetical protein